MCVYHKREAPKDSIKHKRKGHILLVSFNRDCSSKSHWNKMTYVSWAQGADVRVWKPIKHSISWYPCYKNDFFLFPLKEPTQRFYRFTGTMKYSLFFRGISPSNPFPFIYEGLLLISSYVGNHSLKICKSICNFEGNPEDFHKASSFVTKHISRFI